MAIPRASYGMLRSRLRPSPGTAPLSRIPKTQHQTTRSGATAAKGDLGGPGGQERPPQAPGGPESLKRNWAPIGGAALAVAAALAYISGNPPPRSGPGHYPSSDLELAQQTEIGALPQPTVSEETRRRWHSKEIKGMDELSGRKADGYGAFRSE